MSHSSIFSSQKHFAWFLYLTLNVLDVIAIYRFVSALSVGCSCLGFVNNVN